MVIIAPLFFLFVAIIGMVAFHAGSYFPIYLSVALLFLVTCFFISRFQKKRLGALMLLLWVVFTIPFIHIPPYILFDFQSSPAYLWGLRTNPYMFNKEIISLTAMLGAMGSLGIAFGASFSYRKNKLDIGLDTRGIHRRFSTLPFQVWLVWVLIGVTLSWLSAPSKDIFSTNYGGSDSGLAEAGFDSAWMVSYIILTYTFCDAILEKNSLLKALKRKIILSVVAFIVVYLQLLRGDRESVSWVFGLALAHFYWASGITMNRSAGFPWKKTLFLIFLILIISFFIGSLRHNLTNQDFSTALRLIWSLLQSDSFSIFNLLHGTWSAVLLTPLSVSGDYVNGILEFRRGSDYFDILLSLPPGFLADLMGYVRPLNSSSGPAWDMRYGLGGTHASVVPFMNFGMVGVFIIPALWAFILCSYERSVIARLSVINLSLLVTMVMVSPHWLWYGEKYALNAVIIWIILSYLYRISLGFRLKPTVNKNCNRLTR